MRNWVVGIVLIVIFAAAAAFAFISIKQSLKPSMDPNDSKNSMQLKLKSPVFVDNGSIPAEFTCNGSGSRPALEMRGVPANAQSLAIIVFDPDAPGGGFTHWIVWNLSPDTQEIPEMSALSGATEGTNDSGGIGWTPPCPPSGMHHYHFTLYALNSVLSLDSSAKRADLLKAMEGHLVATAALMGEYQKAGSK